MYSSFQEKKNKCVSFKRCSQIDLHASRKMRAKHCQSNSLLPFFLPFLPPSPSLIPLLFSDPLLPLSPHSASHYLSLLPSHLPPPSLPSPLSLHFPSSYLFPFFMHCFLFSIPPSFLTSTPFCPR